jgi:hypothetical protein
MYPSRVAWFAMSATFAASCSPKNPHSLIVIYASKHIIIDDKIDRCCREVINDGPPIRERRLLCSVGQPSFHQRFHSRYNYRILRVCKAKDGILNSYLVKIHALLEQSRQRLIRVRISSSSCSLLSLPHHVPYRALTAVLLLLDTVH